MGHSYVPIQTDVNFIHLSSEPSELGVSQALPAKEAQCGSSDPSHRGNDFVDEGRKCGSRSKTRKHRTL